MADRAQHGPDRTSSSRRNLPKPLRAHESVQSNSEVGGGGARWEGGGGRRGTALTRGVTWASSMASVSLCFFTCKQKVGVVGRNSPLLGLTSHGSMILLLWELVRLVSQSCAARALPNTFVRLPRFCHMTQEEGRGVTVCCGVYSVPGTQQAPCPLAASLPSPRGARAACKRSEAPALSGRASLQTQVGPSAFQVKWPPRFCFFATHSSQASGHRNPHPPPPEGLQNAASWDPGGVSHSEAGV